MSILLPLLLASQIQAVTYRSVAVPVDRLLAELSAKTGLKMQAEGRIASEVVVVAVDKVGIDDLRAKIADVASGKWRTDGERLILSLDESKEREQAKEELTRLAQLYAAAIQEFTRPMNDNGTLSAQEAESRLKQLAELNNKVKQGLAAGTPVGIEPGGTPQERLLYRTLRLLNPADLAVLPPNTRTVFSTAPNRLQRPLPEAVNRALAAFAQEYGIWQSIAERYRPDDENLYVDFGYFGALKAKPAKLLLVATRWGDGMALSLELKIVDQRGKVVSSSAAGLDSNMVQAAETGADETTNEKPIQLSKEALEIGALRTGAFRAPNLPAVSDALRRKLLGPESVDPLAFGPSEILTGLAENESKNLVSVVPDNLFDAVLAASSLQPRSVRAILKATQSVTLETADAWLVGRPTWPHATRTSRTSRMLLGQLVRELDRPNSGSLEPLSKYAVNTPGNGPSNLAQAYLSILHPSQSSGLDTSTWELMRVYATLTAQQKAVMERLKLPFGSLDNRAKAAFHRLVFFSTNAMPMGAFQSMAMSEEPGGQVESEAFESAASEPTEAMPNGLPDAAVLAIDRIEALVAISTIGGAYTAEDLGTQLAMRERPELFPYVGEVPMPNKFQLNNRNSILMTLGIDMEPIASYMLNDLRKGDNRWYGVAEMPQAFRDQVEKSKVDAREAFKGMQATGSGSGGGSNIPPIQPR